MMSSRTRSIDTNLLGCDHAEACRAKLISSYLEREGKNRLFYDVHVYAIVNRIL